MAEGLFQDYKLWNSSSVAGSDDSTLELTRQHKSWGKTFQFPSPMYISILTYSMRFGPNIFGMSVQWRAKRELGNNCTKRSWLKYPLTANQRKRSVMTERNYDIFLCENFQLIVSDHWSLLCSLLWKPFIHSLNSYVKLTK